MEVDGTDYSINQPAPFSKRWYSHKFNGPAIKYKVGVSIQMGHIVWINETFPGKWPDDTTFQRNLKGKLGKGTLTTDQCTLLTNRCFCQNLIIEV